jgi:TP901 family phage tail tape measure protein
MADKKFNLWVVLGLKDANYSRGFAGVKKETASFGNVVNGTLSGVKQAFADLGGVSGTLKLGLVAGGATLIGNAFSNAIRYSIEFEKTLSNLKALTGASSVDMKYYKEAASEMGSQFGETGVEMAEAFKIVGSAKSELLKNKEGLVAVTAAAVTLSKASGMDLPTAADKLVVAMNQLGAPYTEAIRYVNGMAAAAKEGSSEIENQTESLVKFGSVANKLKIPLEQALAMIEALSEKGIKDEIAGTGIKSFLLKLEKGAKDTRPSVVGLQQALENLKKKNIDVNGAQKIFGEEAANVGLALIEQTDRVKQLTKAVTGTNEAFVQAGINGDNVSGALGRLSAKWTNTKESFLNGQGAITSFFKNLLLDIEAALGGLSSILKSKSQLSGEKQKRSNQSEVEAYTKYWQNDKSLTNLKQDITNFNQYKQGWEKRLSEAKKKNDGDEIQRAENKIALYNQLLTLANGELSVRSGKKKADEKNKKSQKNSETKEKDSPFDTFSKDLKSLEKDHNTYLVEDKEYYSKKIEIYKTYLSELNKLGQSDSKAYKEWSQLSTEELMKNDAAEVKFEPAKLDAKDLDSELDLGNYELPVPIELKSDKEKFDEQLAKIQDKLHPLELEVAIRGTNDVLNAVGSLQNLGNAFDDLAQKQAAGEDGFFDYVAVMQQSVSAFTGIYDGITDLIAIIQALDAAKSVSATLSATTAATEVAANTVKSTSNIAAATTSVAASTAEGAATTISSALASVPFPWNLVIAAGAGAAAMALFSGLMKFENGGVVGGNSFSGDKVLARVNSGEMILNKSQQARLFSMINSGTSGGSGTSGSRVEFKIRGEELFGVMKNYQSRKKVIGG